MLADLRQLDTATTILGCAMPCPVLFAYWVDRGEREARLTDIDDAT